MSRADLPIVVGITGASGAIYAVRLLDVLSSLGRRVQLSISPSGAAVIAQELGQKIDVEKFTLDSLLPSRDAFADSARFATLRGIFPRLASHEASLCGTTEYFHHQNFFAPMASGSARSAGMVICPCSGGTLSAVANAASDNLIQRAADVHLKERRMLVLVPRETPMSVPQLENMTRCAEYGAVVLPAMPGFYQRPSTLGELVDFVVARILDQFDVEHQLMKRWGEKE
ncbi:MAG: UbiX family flavin prenyltransferase [Planctomycetes bacterium]|nr:UbiX family flavin prenyltransferase [Planctomycetota bacterium]